MNEHAFNRFDARYRDLIARAKTMRASGYHASADALLERAWLCADQREAVAMQAFLSDQKAKRNEGATHA